MLLSCLEVALNTYFKSCKNGILLKTFFRLIDYYVPKKYFMSLRIFKRQGRRTRGYQNHCRRRAKKCETQAFPHGHFFLLVDDFVRGSLAWTLEHWASQLYKLQSNLFNTDTKGTEPNLLFALQRGPY